VTRQTLEAKAARLPDRGPAPGRPGRRRAHRGPDLWDRHQARRRPPARRLVVRLPSPPVRAAL